MNRAGAARICALTAFAALVITACGDSGKTESSEPTATNRPPFSSTTSTDTNSTVAATTTTTTIEALRTIEVAFEGGQVVGGTRRETVRLGEKVRVRVTSDIADEVHIHTYDLSGAVAPGQPVELTFTADIPGRHEVELEKKRKQLLTLEVR